jgi:tripartite-type tricarboxylate transporter receptor subunit TctC
VKVHDVRSLQTLNRESKEEFVANRSGAYWLAAALLISVPGGAAAQSWPSRPVTIVVPFGAGGSLDIPARRLAAELSMKLGQQFVVDNRPGANGNIGAAYVAKSNPDGYTLMFSPPGPLVTNRFMYKNLPFDADQAFAHIILLAKSPMVIAANPMAPASTLQELLAYAKANPGKLTVGTPGIGSQVHLTMELLQKLSGSQVTYVPYRGAAGSSADAISGQIDVSLNFTPAVIGTLRAGSLRGLAVTTLQRAKQLPDIPTVSESGFPGFEAVASYSFVAPADTPREIIATLNRLTNEYIDSDIGKRQLESADMQPAGGTPGDLQKFIAGEVAKWGPIIKAAGINM